MPLQNPPPLAIIAHAKLVVELKCCPMSGGAQLRIGGHFHWNKDKLNSVACDIYVADVIYFTGL